MIIMICKRSLGWNTAAFSGCAGDLAVGRQNWFHVRAFRANDRGPWNDPAKRLAER